jgi:hypothetical protein
MERTSRLRALRSANDTSPTHARVRVESEMRRITDFPTGQINDYAPLAGPSMKAVILPDGQIKKSCPALPKKIFLFSFDPNHPHIDAVSPHRGAYRDRHGRGMRCGGRGSVGAIGDRGAGLSCERAASARTNGVASVFAKASADGYQARRSLVAKTGCVRQNRVVPTPVAGAKLSVASSIQPDRPAFKPAATVTRTNSLAGESTA